MQTDPGLELGQLKVELRRECVGSGDWSLSLASLALKWQNTCTRGLSFVIFYSKWQLARHAPTTVAALPLPAALSLSHVLPGWVCTGVCVLMYMPVPKWQPASSTSSSFGLGCFCLAWRRRAHQLSPAVGAHRHPPSCATCCRCRREIISLA